jgi:hypothetical protein
MLIHKRRSGQPQGAFKLRSNLGFDSFALPGVGADLVTGKPLLISGTVSTGGAQIGRAFSPSSGATLFVTSNASTLLSTDGATIVMAGRTINPATNAQVDYGIPGADPSGGRCNVAFVASAAYWDFGGTSGPNRISYSLAGVTLYDTDVWVFTAGARGIEIWRNGGLMTSGSTAITRSTSTSNFGMWDNPGRWYAVGYSRQQMPKETCAALSRDLWGTAFVQRRRGIIATLAAAARRRIVMWG